MKRIVIYIAMALLLVGCKYADEICAVSISVENFPPVSVQKFPHGLVG